MPFRGETIHEWFERMQAQSSVHFDSLSNIGEGDWVLESGEVVNPHVPYKGVAFWAQEGDRRVHRFMLAPDNNPNGIVVLAAQRPGGSVLVQAKAEPGARTPGCVVLNATLATSRLGLERNPNLPFRELAEHWRLTKASIVQDPGNFLGKFNEVGVARMDDDAFDGELPDSFFVARPGEVFELAQKGWVSDHLMQALGILCLLGG